MMKLRCCTVTASLVAVLIAGCGGSGPRLVSVTGTVTHNDKPLEGAVVSFHPDPSNKDGQPGEDITGAAGNYKIMTKGRSGLVPGKYHVSVTKVEVDPADAPSQDFRDDPFMAQLSATDAASQGRGKKKDKGQIEGSFEREVPPEGGEQDFDVKSTSPSK